jgi:hypothetical protein
MLKTPDESCATNSFTIQRDERHRTLVEEFPNTVISGTKRGP